MNRDVATLTDTVGNRSFWSDLAPQLSISDIPWTPEVDDGKRNPAVPVEVFGEAGYVSIPGLLPAHLTTALAAGLDALTAADLPTPFLFMYDETWQAYQQLDDVVTQLMGPGYLLGGDLWAWSLESVAGAQGWNQHRDSMYKVPDRGTDGEPNYASLWVSLTDATTNNGCIHVVPRQDPPLKLESPEVVQRAVPLEAPAGSLLAWAPDIIHWSSPVSGPGISGRKSFAVFAQRGDIPALSWDMVRIGEPVPFDYRLGMVCRQLLRYIDSSLHPDLNELASWRDFANEQEKRFRHFLTLLAKINGRHPEEIQ